MAFEITEKWLSEIAGWQVMKPAKSLASSGAVLKADFDGRILRGLVMDGKKRLACGLKIAGISDVTNLCSCRDARMTGAICAHSIATGLIHLQQAASKVPARSDAESAKSSAVTDSPSAGDGQDRLLPSVGDRWLQQIRQGSLQLRFSANNGGQSLEGFSSCADRNICEALRALGQQRLPEHLSVPTQKAGDLFYEVVAHPQFRAGNLAARVAEVPGRLLVRIKRVGDQQVDLEIMTKGDAIVLGEKRWWWSGGEGESSGLLQPLGVPTEFLGLLAKGKLTVPESAFARLVEPFFDAFEESLDSDAALISACRGRMGVPQVILKLEGSLRALDGWLKFAYPGGGPVVELGGDVSQEFPYQDSSGVRIRRNDDWEMMALTELRENQFEFGRESLQLRGEEKILRFLSTTLPGLKRRWKVEIGERFEHVSKAVSMVQPTVDWNDSGAGHGDATGEDWLEFGVSYATDDGSQVAVSEIQRMLRVGQSKHDQANGKKAIVNLEGVQEWNASLEEAGVQFVGDRIRVPSTQASFIAAALGQLGAEVPGGFGEKISGDFQISKELAAFLRDYQASGVRWLSERAGGYGGAILGDEMGLGKTLQTLAFLSGLRAAQNSEPDGDRQRFLAVVICPASLLWNWEAEVAKFLPDFKTIVLHGTSRGKLFRKLNDYDIAITTYSLAVRDLEKWAEVPLSAAVMDEASYLRNPDTKVAKAVRSLASRVPVRVALTGTPIENGVKDLWSIMECVVPGYLGTRTDFKERYEKPLAATVGLTSSDVRRLTERLNRRIQPFFLRRTKKVVARDLPSKIESVQLVELSKMQTELYRGISREAADQIQDTLKTGGGGAARMHMLTALLRLRQVCCDPRLLTDQAKAADSAKLEMLNELIENLLNDGHSVLVFSQFVSMLRIMRQNLDARDVGYCYLDGASSDRKEQVASFQSDREKRAFLISLKAGGYGLNLTKADVVIHYDPWWNPAVEAQATDRAHRIGQTRAVTVYKLIARSSVEEKILRLQKRKRDVMDAALDDQQPMMRGLNDQDLLDLLQGD
ncbi:MAG: hypothetical protein ACI9R3_003736 [Verrucomicrobiales bacterium]|jgi:hypothetical protein